MFALINKLNIYYEIHGHHEDCVVLLHGNGEDHTIFSMLVDKLARDFKVIVVDMRSHGQSDYVSYLNYEDMMGDIFELINSLHLKRVSIVGFSDGGIIGLMLAYTYPYLIKNLVACSPNINPKGFKLTEYMKMKKEYLLHHEDKVRLMLEQPDIKLHELERITCPVLLLCGQNDVIKQSHFDDIVKAIPNCMMKVFPKENHYSYIVNSDKAFVDIDLFLRKH